jgi:hypothetical protein
VTWEHGHGKTRIQQDSNGHATAGEASNAGSNHENYHSSHRSSDHSSHHAAVGLDSNRNRSRGDGSRCGTSRVRFD